MTLRAKGKWSSDSRAFTLMELVIATLVAAVVLAAMNTAFYAALRLRSSTAGMIEDIIPSSRCISILKSDLRGTLVTGGPMALSFESPGVANANNQPTELDIFTTTGAIADDQPWGDVQKISYYLKDPSGISHPVGKDLVRAITRNLLAPVQPDVSEQTLLSGVSSMDFTFFDGTSWLTAWDSTSAATPTPQAVKVEIQFASGDAGGQGRLPIEMVVPIDSQQPTNSVAGAGTGGGVE